MTERPIVIVSNRGPVSFVADPEAPSGIAARRGAGGLVSALSPLVRGTDATWVAAAMTDGDRIVAGRGATDAEGFRVRLVDVDPATWTDHYDRVCNEALWFAHHGLWDAVLEPSWPAGWLDGPWAAHRRVNAAFADAVAEVAPAGAVVLVQDYHLCLLALTLRQRRPDLALVHFSHTPFAARAWWRMLPTPAAREVLEGLVAHDACGFHSARWERDFRDCCDAFDVAPGATFLAPLGPDPDDLAATAAGPEAVEQGRALHELVGDRRFIVRVDRLELSKNVRRGFEAFGALLEAEPAWRGQVVFGAFVYPSRVGVPAYDRYAAAVAEVVDEVNGRFATDDWTPIVYDPTDHYPRSVAALARADAVLVNPVRDGLNLVAMEMALLNQREGQLLLSPAAGAWDDLGDAGAWRVDPFDVGATAAAMHAALAAPDEERARRAARLRSAVSRRTPAGWLAAQLDAAPPT